MNKADFTTRYRLGQLMSEFGDWLAEQGEIICNGDMLLEAWESGDFDQQFEDYMTGETA